MAANKVTVTVALVGRQPLGQTLAGILAIHLLRVLALFAISARRNGFPLTKAALTEIVGGDLVGAAIALVAVIALVRQSELGIWIAWLVVVETVVDLAVAIRRRRRLKAKRADRCCSCLPSTSR